MCGISASCSGPLLIKYFASPQNLILRNTWHRRMYVIFYEDWATGKLGTCKSRFREHILVYMVQKTYTHIGCLTQPVPASLSHPHKFKYMQIDTPCMEIPLYLFIFFTVVLFLSPSTIVSMFAMAATCPTFHDNKRPSVLDPNKVWS